MAKSHIPLNTNTTVGPKADTRTNTRADLSGPFHRTVSILGGEGEDELVVPTNTAPASDAYGIPVRPIGTPALPTDAATQTTLASVLTAVQALAAALPLPTGAATQTTLASVLTAVQALLTAIGDLQSELELKANLIETQPVSLAAVPLATDAATQTTLAALLTATQALAAALPLPAGAATAAKQPAIGTAGTPSADVLTAQGKAGMTPFLVDGSATTQPVSGTVTANAGTGTFTAKEVRSATPTQSTVAASASSVSLLAANSSRLGATITNDSTVTLYLKLGATASTSSFTVKLNGSTTGSEYYEVPYGYTGAIDGIWASATGNARITELV